MQWRGRKYAQCMLAVFAWILHCEAAAAAASATYALYAYSFGNFRNETRGQMFEATMQTLGEMQGIDCYFYTDRLPPRQQRAMLNSWTTVVRAQATATDTAAAASAGIATTRVRAKRLKWDPPPELHRYSYLVHVDCSCHSLQTAVTLLQNNALKDMVHANPHVALFIRKNGIRTTMQQEVRAVMQSPKLNPSGSLQTWHAFLKAADLYGDINAVPLPHTNFFVRNMADNAIIRAGKTLLDVELAQGLWRDQTVYGYIFASSAFRNASVMYLDAQWGGYKSHYEACKKQQRQRTAV